jgi:hypothetical protein
VELISFNAVPLLSNSNELSLVFADVLPKTRKALGEELCGRKTYHCLKEVGQQTAPSLGLSLECSAAALHSQQLSFRTQASP